MEKLSFKTKVELWQKKINNWLFINKRRIYTPSGKDWTTDYGMEIFGFGFYFHIPSFITNKLWFIK